MKTPLQVQCNVFPGGKQKAVTLSYDDGPSEDYRFVELLNRQGLKATFHLNSGLLGLPEKVKPEDVRSLYAGHEVSVHGRHHLHLDGLPPEQLVYELLEDRRALEELTGGPVTGMSHPYGSYNERVVQTLDSLGFRYARTGNYHFDYHLPQDLLRWHPTCHHNDDVPRRAKEFLAMRTWDKPRLFYLLGHSFEFERQQTWPLIEEITELLSGRDDVWYATSLEIADYLSALRRLRFTLDRSLVQNPNASAVWITVDDHVVEIPGGAELSL